MKGDICIFLNSIRLVYFSEYIKNKYNLLSIDTINVFSFVF